MIPLFAGDDLDIPPFAIAASRDIAKILRKAVAIERVNRNQSVWPQGLRKPLEIEDAGVSRSVDDFERNAVGRKFRL
jgi:hypothetical protein